MRRLSSILAPALFLTLLLVPLVPAASIPAETLPCLPTGEIVLSQADRFREGRACHEIPNGGTFQWTNLENRRYFLLSEPDGGRCFAAWSGSNAGLPLLGNTTIELTYDASIDRLRARGWSDEGNELKGFNETSGDWESPWVCSASVHDIAPDGPVEVRWTSPNQPGAMGLVRLRLE